MSEFFTKRNLKYFLLFDLRLVKVTLSFSPGALLSCGDGVDNGWSHQCQGGAGGRADQGDEQVQPGDARGQAEGEEDQTESEEVLHLQVFVRRYSLLDVGVDDVHRDIELDGVAEEDGEGHHDLD